MGRRIEQGRIVPEIRLRAVTVVNVEIDHGDALKAVRALRMTAGDGNGVEQAEPHGSIRFGMMARRSHSTEHGIGLARHDRVYRLARGTDGPQGCFTGPRRHDRITVDLDKAGIRDRIQDGAH